MPTGGGKSLTFQVPALCMDGICIVVTPLIALMKDQVDNLKRVGIKATAVYSGMTRPEIITQLENCIFGGYKFLYVSPERLGTEIFLSKLQAMQVSLLVVDESHCISQWGYDFRPSYLKITDVRAYLPGIPVLALTATATPEVVNDIQERLGFRSKNVFQKSFSRKNLSYVVRKTADKTGELVHILQKIPGTAIVYVRNRKRTREIADCLRQAGISADYFHAGLNREEKDIRQNRWKSGECRVIVSTNAFGMGIDKPDVRLVVHMDMPGSLEEYYQEAGRAGRDEQRSYAVSLTTPADSASLKRRLSDEFPEREYICRVYEALGNFFQIAVGFGLDTVHDFSLNAFCSAYKFPLLQTHHALKILELSGYIEYTEEIDNASRIYFTCHRDELYKYPYMDKRTDDLIQVLLRSYTGLFADYVFINESLLATRAGMTGQEVYEILSALSKHRILHYIPQKKTPLVVYTRAREELKYLVIPRSAYEERKDRFDTRIRRVLEYITGGHVCRSRMLLAYFGEENTADCGTCDVCLQKNASGLTNYEVGIVRDHLLESPAGTPEPVTEIIERLSLSPAKCIGAIRFLADTDNRFLLEDGNLRIRIEAPEE